MLLNNSQADQELFRNYKAWCAGTANLSNAPGGCNQITQDTANYLRGKWNPSSKPNSWNQSASSGVLMKKTGDTRWVSRSVSGGSDVVDFHSLYLRLSVRFLWHFQIV
jgi:hypothetical protein